MSEADRDTLARISRKGKAAQRDVLRARIILLTAAGESDLAVAEQLQINRHTVRLWRQRFAEKGLAGLTDIPGRARKPVLTHGVMDSILPGPVQPPPHRARWSCRSMAKAHKVSKSTVQRLWSNNDIKPHLTRTFKISNHPRFEEQFWDVIGLYVNPPDKALGPLLRRKESVPGLRAAPAGLTTGSGVHQDRNP